MPTINWATQGDSFIIDIDSTNVRERRGEEGGKDGRIETGPKYT